MTKISAGVLATLGLLGLSALASATTTAVTTSQRVPVAVSASLSASSISAVDALVALKVKGRAPKTGYDRKQFGAAWTDTDRNGCDTRNDVLRRDLTSTTLRPSDCVVLTGTLSDPYSGSSITFTRGAASADVQIDHLVALGDAWVTGAQALTPTRRTELANDPLNLLAVKGSLNEQKRDADAASWLPPRKAFRCDYVARQIAVKRAYRLWVTVAEQKAMARVLTSCDEQVLPTRSQVAPPPRVSATTTPASPSPTAPTTSSPAVTTSPPPAASATTTASTMTDPRFRTCAEAKAAGYGPYYRGRDPEYPWYRDADSDGVVCE